MNEYRHHVSGFFAHREDANTASSVLVKRGFTDDQLQILEGGATPQAASPPMTKSDGVLQDVLVDGAIGTAVGTGIGAIAEIGLVAANVSLFIASPLVAPLVAMVSSQVGLVAETRTEEETSIAREVIQASVGECEDVSMA